MPDTFPWREAMAFGLGRLRLPPEAFWAMTPRELALAGEGFGGRIGGPLDRQMLNELMSRYPDKTPDKIDGE
jgi:uncharacterized phage protein (TIGR02216 family)